MNRDSFSIRGGPIILKLIQCDRQTERQKGFVIRFRFFFQLWWNSWLIALEETVVILDMLRYRFPNAKCYITSFCATSLIPGKRYGCIGCDSKAQTAKCLPLKWTLRALSGKAHLPVMKRFSISMFHSTRFLCERMEKWNENKLPPKVCLFFIPNFFLYEANAMSLFFTRHVMLHTLALILYVYLTLETLLETLSSLPAAVREFVDSVSEIKEHVLTFCWNRRLYRRFSKIFSRLDEFI